MEMLSHKWATTIQKTNELEGAVHLLEAEVASLRKRAKDQATPIEEDN